MQKSEEEWKKELTPEQYRVLRQKGTEAPFTGQLYLNKDKGIYQCAACGNDLFTSEMKFDSGCGWPSFDKEIEGGKIMHSGHARPCERHQDVVGRVQQVVLQLARMRAKQHIAQACIGFQCARLEGEVLAQASKQLIRRKCLGRIFHPAYRRIQAQGFDIRMTGQTIGQLQRVATDPGQRRTDCIDIEDDAH